MKTSQTGIALIKYFEGVLLKSYICPAGIWTIGIGHTKGVKEGMVITETKAEELLKKDLGYFEDHVTELVKIPITQNQFDALVSFAFNVGEGSLRRSTLLKKLNNVITPTKKVLENVSNEFLRWNKAKGKDGKLKPVTGLTRRRRAERTLFLTEIKLQDILNEIDKLAIPRPPEVIKRIEG